MPLYKRALLLFFLLTNTYTSPAQIWFSEDCSTANGTTAPENWTTETATDASINEVWAWNNPGNRDLPLPMEAPFAIFDSDFYGSGVLEEYALWTSPVIDLSEANVVIMDFDQQFRYWENNGGLLRFRTGSDSQFDEWQVVYQTPMEDVGFHLDPDSNAVVTTSLDLSDWLANASEAQIQFVYDGNWGYWWAIDNVKVYTPSFEQGNLLIVDFYPQEPAICWQETIGFDLLLANSENEVIENLNLDYSLVASDQDEVDGNINLSNIGLQGGDTMVLSNVLNIPLSQLGEIDLEISIENAVNDFELSFYNSGIENLPINNDSEKYDSENYDLENYDLENVVDFAYYDNWLNLDDLNTPNNQTGDWTESLFANEPNHHFALSKVVTLQNSISENYWVSPFFLASETTMVRFDYAITQQNTNTFTSLETGNVFELRVFDECNEELLVLWEATDSLGYELLDLSSYTGNYIRLVFAGHNLAEDNLIAKELFVDNVHIFDDTYQDLSLVGLPEFFNQPCFVQGEDLSIQLTNLGTETISINKADFFQGSLNGNEFSLPADFSINPNDTISIALEGLSFGGIDSGELENVFNLQLNTDEEQMDLLFNNAYTYNIQISENLSSPLLVDFEGEDWGESFFKYDSNAQSFFNNDSQSSNTLSYSFDFIGGNTGVSNTNNLLTKAIDLEEGSFLFFDMAVSDFLDSNANWFNGEQALEILISTDCGIDFEPLAAYNNQTQAFTKDTLSLSQYGAGNIVIAFQISGEGETPVQLFLDNIEIKRISDVDIALVNFVQPNTQLFCYGSTESIGFDIQNQGIQNIDFSVSNLSLQFQLVFSDSTVLDSIYTIDSGTLLSGQTMEITLPENFDFSQNGLYGLYADFQLEGDTILENNALIDFSINNLGLDYDLLFGIDFDYYEGDNLNEIEPKWREYDGQFQPDLSSTDSEWENDYFANNPGNENELCAQINLWQNDKSAWLIGPRILIADTTALLFDLALTNWATSDPASLGSDDTLAVMLSTDCGISFFPVQVYSEESVIAPTGQTETIELINYTGAEAILAFYATDGLIDDEADTEIFIDNIRVEGLFLPPGDVGVVETVSPTEQTCETDMGSLAVRTFNFSERKLSDYVVVVEISGAVDTLLTDTVSTPVESLNSDFSFFSIGELYGDSINVVAYTTLQDDINSSNDTSLSTVKILSFPESDLIADTSVCGAFNYFPNINGDYTDCTWSNGETSHAIYIEESDLYVLTLKNEICIVRDSTEVEILPVPQAAFTVAQNDLDVIVESFSLNSQNNTWLINGETFEEVDLLSYSFPDTGQYQISLIATDSICGTDTLVQELNLFFPPDTTTSINNVWNGSDGFQLFPNPVQDFAILRFESSPNQKMNVQIIGANGKLEKEFTIEKENTILNLSDLNVGHYIVLVSKQDSHQHIARLPFQKF